MGILGTAAGSRNKDRKKKPDELLSSVVRETAIPAAVELLRSNAKFVFPSGTAWVMLVLAAESIGGLSKRHGRDEAKGSLIELIDSDQIKTVATAEMLGEEVFGIIPNTETLARMEEYSLLAGAEYSWAVVWQKPSGELLVDLVAEATFKQAQEVASGTLSLEEAVGAQAWREHSGVTTDEPGTRPAADADAVAAVDTADEGDPIFDSISGGDEGAGDEPVFDAAGDEPVFDDEAVDFGDEDAAPVAVEPEPGFDGTAGFEEFDEESGPVTADDTAYAPAEEEAVLLENQEQVREVIARRFLSEDLDLDVRLDEFNATFAIGAPVVQIEVPQGATEWLGDQVAQLNRQANADLAQLRWAHEDELRTLYVNLMSAHVEQVIRDVATDREGSRYKALKDGTEAAHRERESEKEQRIRTRKAEIVQDYEAQAKKLAEQAALQAEIQYKERNRSRMEREQADAVAEIERVLENSYSHDRQEILRVRRSDAALKMQVGTTRIFEVLAEKQKAYLEAEEQRLGQWKAEIQRIVDDNRKADIAQAEALAEHQRTTDEIGVLRREQEALLESIRNEHADRIRRMEDELDRNRKDAITQMQARETEWQHSLSLEKEKTDSATQRNTDLLQQMEVVEDSVKRRYEARLEEMAADKESYASELARASEIQSRYNKMLIALIVALPVLGGLAGFIGGAAMGG
ncbi:hypothetical protein ACIQF8_03330 [Pseudarthrobacter sp. NPDC092184]|jgi:hypothetical protein|uniref:hypothetical protein n=1 Tax=Micrococcaceae TaxID=1268 RepID=UPI001154D06D|nr:MULTISPECIES: hypothetical protein [Micrococcaceae]MBD1591290.1 hypothetical protein [Arthrobacter sp. S1_S22]MCR1163265.1 hypothetical protein [Paenarthrobacter sp. UW852]TQJ60881.1 hypothetical protein FBY30_3158 [Arthrobacter sp. SLBN-83]TWD56676.1 hypothetical protein FB478_101833 [Arthrobacter sp. AG367]